MQTETQNIMKQSEERKRDIVRRIVERDALEKAGMVYVPMRQARRKLLLTSPVWYALVEAGVIKLLISDEVPANAVERQIKACMFPTKELAAAFMQAVTAQAKLDEVEGVVDLRVMAPPITAMITQEDGTKRRAYVDRAYVEQFEHVLFSEGRFASIRFNTKPQREGQKPNKFGHNAIMDFLRAVHGKTHHVGKVYGAVIYLSGHEGLLEREPQSHTLN